MSQIKLIISDFDGTLVDTIDANYFAYLEVFKSLGITIDKKLYEDCFGLRIGELLKKIAPKNYAKINLEEVKRRKSRIYPKYFSYLKLNESLLNYYIYCKKNGIQLAIASTASKSNIINILKYYKIESVFDYIVAGEDVIRAKPFPDAFQMCLDFFGCSADEAVVYEDSKIGFEASIRAEINYIKIKL